MYSKEKQYIENNSNNLSKALEIVVNRNLHKKVTPFTVRAFMSEMMVELITHYPINNDGILFDSGNGKYVEFFIIHIFENRVEYAKKILKSTEVSMMMSYSKEYSDKLEWTVLEHREFADAYDMIKQVKDIFSENSDYVPLTKAKKVKENIFTGVVLLLFAAMVVVCIGGIVNDVSDREITSIIPLCTGALVGFLVGIRKKKKFLNK